MSEENIVVKKNNGFGRWIAAALALAAIGGGFYYWQSTKDWESTDDAQIDSRIHLVSTRISGTVVKVNVEDNQKVEAGAVLAEIDPGTYQVAVEQARAAVAQAQADAAASRSNVPVVATSTSTQLSGAKASLDEVKAAMATAQRQVQATRARLPVVEAQLRQAQANYARTAADVDRYQALVAKEEISQQQFDTAKSAAAAAKAQVDAAEAQIAEAKRGVEVSEQRVAQEQAHMARAESDVKSAASGPEQVAATKARAEAAAARVLTEQARLKQAELDLERTVIRTPVAGVARRNVEIGQVVQAGQPVVTVVPLNEIWVEANFKESQLARIRTGQPAEVEVDAFGGRSYHGKVESISPATGARFSLLPPENATGNYVKVVQRVSVKISLDPGQDSEHQLRPGMSVAPRVRVR